MRKDSFQNYTDYFKCVAAKGEDFAPCKQFKRAYNSLCPSKHFEPLCGVSLTYFFVDEWVWYKHLLYYSPVECLPQIGRFDEQRENGTFPASLEP